jgi:hypothetical protein
MTRKREYLLVFWTDDLMSRYSINLYNVTDGTVEILEMNDMGDGQSWSPAYPHTFESIMDIIHVNNGKSAYAFDHWRE